MSSIREVLYQHQKGVAQRQISRSFDISRDTVRKYINLANQEGLNTITSDEALNKIAIRVRNKLYQSSLQQKAPAMSVLAGYREKIGDLLQQKNITHTQIQRLLLDEGIKVSTRSINRFIEKEFPQTPKSTVHIKTVPGQEGQVDFGYVGTMPCSNGKNRKLYVFVMTLSHSRYRYVEFTFSQDQVSWAQLHINAFNFFGGVPSRVVLDNLKSGVVTPDIYDPTVNETYSELSRFYGFTVDPAKVYKPEHKGKVERSIRIVKEQLIAGKSYLDIDHANKEAAEWCRYAIPHRICSTTGSKPVDIFLSEEKPCLIALPVDVFDMPIWTTSKVQRDHHFVVKGNFYSVPTKYIGKTLNIRIGLKTVSAYCNHQIIKTHPRNHNKGQWVTDEKDYSNAAQHYLENTPSRCLASAKEIGEGAYEIVLQTLGTSGSRRGLRKAQAILRLSEKYNDDRLEAACLRAIAYDNYDYKAISNILESKLDEQQNKPAEANKIIDIEDSAYIRDPSEYSSSMEVNYV